ncbi:MAG: polyprenyl synthetase family protein [Bacteroidota bacterium]|nr:polyprenyl synthetase family protein [Bacteroidota bacterium]
MAFAKEPLGLYAPISYILKLGGKRIRPVLALIACEAVGKSPSSALGAATAVELFHNFTLLHDDIIDEASLRRGQQTVHQKWDINAGILSGDALLVIAYQQLNQYEDTLFSQLTKLLSETALLVCEGQQYDVDFETRNDVSLDAYIKMIQLKTAVLLGCALRMGALVGNATKVAADCLYEFGANLGIAFQLQDDLLDAFGDPKTFGKKIGGDIVENKKTILYHLTMAHANDHDKARFEQLMTSTPADENKKITAVKTIYEATEVPRRTVEQVSAYTNKAMDALQQSTLSSDQIAYFTAFADELMVRTK